MKTNIITLALALFVGCAHANPYSAPLVRVTNESELKDAYTENDKKWGLTTGTTEKSMKVLGISDKDILDNKPVGIGCSTVRNKSVSAFKKASTSREKRAVNIAIDVSNSLFQCTMKNIT